MGKLPLSLPELWAGVECTVNRIGDRYFDQLEHSGHSTRVADLDLFAELGIRTLRYPVLWERTAPTHPEHHDWRWADERLSRLRKLGIRPIVGLVHHGSGPAYTSLVDPNFPEGLAHFARAFAERFPWVEWYTPVNEPLTTARFSGLYGHWYPHGRDASTFTRAFLTQGRAIVLAMRAIRDVTPEARLIQTEDLGKTFSTRRLAYQADFENERRWLTMDLLCGRVSPDHPLWSYLLWAGASVGELEFFREHTCPPDVVGINHYITSERFLDHRTERYPAHCHGRNETEYYADVAAVRVRSGSIAGPRVLLREAWERYRLPIAITEAHLGCTREEQLRWLHDAWTAARGLRREGVEIRAVTVWSLLGAYNWNSLLTRDEGSYEPGVFDTRSPTPRPTALASMVRDLAAGREPGHPVLSTPGWWRRPIRLLFPLARSAQPTAFPHRKSSRTRSPRPLVITGATGTLGRAFARICEVRGLEFRLLGRSDMDIASPASVSAALERHEPWAVVNTAGYVRVDDAESDAERCFRENTVGPSVLAAACAARGMALLTFSSDLVFDGGSTRPYVESDGVQPLNAYGRSKAEAERRVLQDLPSALVIRTSAFFGPWDEHNFVTLGLRALAAGESWTAAEDAIVSPTYVPDLVHASLDLLIDGEEGIWHLANPGALSWAEFARRAAELAGMDGYRINGQPAASLGLPAPRPVYSALGSERGVLLPPLKDALSRYCAERPHTPTRRTAIARSAMIGGSGSISESCVASSSHTPTADPSSVSHAVA